MAERPIKLTIAALGGQGGGVLADWLIEIAEAEGYLVQSTSVRSPGTSIAYWPPSSRRPAAPFNVGS
jgi:indolepyruvate ferredoxin oxidoreductase, beta subunit